MEQTNKGTWDMIKLYLKNDSINTNEMYPPRRQPH